jgi:hypothetical protein
MKNKTFSWTVRFVVVGALAVVATAQAQAPRVEHLSGLINDYTAATGVSGPWEMHGKWTLKLKEESGKADFSGFMTMEHSDAWIAANPGAVTNPPTPSNVDTPASRSPHTHHITMTDALVTYDMTVCPANSPATTSAGFVVTGNVSITGNGNSAPFEKNGPSTMQVCITGGSEVQFANISLVLTGPATGHFGTHAINGVVREVKHFDKHDDKHDDDHHDGRR